MGECYVRSTSARFPRLVPGLDFKSSVERVTTFQAGSIPVPRRQAARPPHARPFSRPTQHPALPRQLERNTAADLTQAQNTL
jgi:hypothetical protein